MAIELSENDFVPLSQCEFQHWGERSGPPFCHMRALAPDAAQRVWCRTAEAAAAAWEGGDQQLDLTSAGDWAESSVRDRLLPPAADRDPPVLVCLPPPAAVVGG